jgi:hypothetical protein
LDTAVRPVTLSATGRFSPSSEFAPPLVQAAVNSAAAMNAAGNPGNLELRID